MARSVVMPSFGMYTVEGILASWLKPSGAMVEEGEAILEIETEKSVLEVMAPESGILHHAVQVGVRLQVESLIGYVLSPGEAIPSPLKAVPSVSNTTPASPPAIVTAEKPKTPLASPIARRLATENGIELSSLIGSGPGGRITEADVKAALARLPGQVV